MNTRGKRNKIKKRKPHVTKNKENNKRAGSSFKRLKNEGDTHTRT